MRETRQNTMKAVAIDLFGGPEIPKLQTLPVSEIGPDGVLIRIESADLAVSHVREQFAT